MNNPGLTATSQVNPRQNIVARFRQKNSLPSIVKQMVQKLRSSMRKNSAGLDSNPESNTAG
jgi:hypothetical protein